MKIKLKHCMLSHEGKVYEVGEILDIKDTALAKRLVSRSKGDIEFYHDTDYFNNAAGMENEGSEEIAGLPEVDPSVAIEGGKRVKK